MVHLLIFQWWGYKMSVILMGPGIVSRAMYFNGNSGTYHLPSGLGTSGLFNGADGVESYNQIYSPNVTSLYGRDAWMAKGGQQYFMCSTISNPSANKFLAGGPAGATRLNVYSGGRPSIETITNLNNYASNLSGIPRTYAHKRVRKKRKRKIKTQTKHEQINIITTYTES
jgi:hypothetical protein